MRGAFGCKSSNGPKRPEAFTFHSRLGKNGPIFLDCRIAEKPRVVVFWGE